MNIRQTAQRLLRRSGLLPFAEDLRYHLQRLRLKSENTAYLAKHPDAALPPLHLLYEIGGRIRLSTFLRDGSQSATFLVGKASDWLTPGHPVRVLDWGSGVACVVRHMPQLLPSGSTAFGSDYNAEMISWSQQAIPGVTFSRNDLLPPLPFEDHTLDWIYGLSVVTHLGENALHAWLAEFHRILKPGGILTLSTNGTGCEGLFSSQELTTYREKGIVVRGGLEEGRKMFLTYHSPEYFTQILSPHWEVLDFSAKGMPFSGQDLWWCRAKPSA